VDCIREDSEDGSLNDSRQQQQESALARHAGQYMREKAAFQRTFGKEYDLDIDELNSNNQTPSSQRMHQQEEHQDSDINETRCLQESELMKVRNLRENPIRGQLNLDDSMASIQSSNKNKRPSRW